MRGEVLCAGQWYRPITLRDRAARAIGRSPTGVREQGRQVPQSHLESSRYLRYYEYPRSVKVPIDRNGHVRSNPLGSGVTTQLTNLMAHQLLRPYLLRLQVPGMQPAVLLR